MENTQNQHIDQHNQAFFSAGTCEKCKCCCFVSIAAPHNQWYEMGAGLLVWLTNDRQECFEIWFENIIFPILFGGTEMTRFTFESMKK